VFHKSLAQILRRSEQAGDSFSLGLISRMPKRDPESRIRRKTWIPASAGTADLHRDRNY
jgi:hypothetical protein